MAAPLKVEFHFDFGSPNAYLAELALPGIEKRTGVKFEYVPILLGGISASGGLLQRRLGLPDASVLVLQGIIFVFVLASDALYGRIGFLKGKS